MKDVVRVPLQTTPDQARQLTRLQEVFAQACNALAPLVRSTRCWNRVALHHMAYKQLREQFPALGSQMVCNAIYSVCRASRHVYQHPSSPFHVQRLGGRTLPLLRFLPQAPVYFDRHTLSLKSGQASLYTLDGRMRFELGLDPALEQSLRAQRLREIVLERIGSDRFALSFHLVPAAQEPGQAEAAIDGPTDFPEYLLIEDEPAGDPPPPAAQPVLQTP